MKSPFGKKKKTVRSSVNYEGRTLPALPPPKPPHTKPPLERKESYDQSLNPFSEDNEDLTVDSDSESLDNQMNEYLCESANASASSRESLDVSGGGASLADSMDSGLDTKVDVAECSGSNVCSSPDTPDTLVDAHLEDSATQQAQNQKQKLVLWYFLSICVFFAFCSI